MSARRRIVAALSEDSMGGIATLQDVDHAEHLVDAHAAEVRRQDAARLLDARARHASRAVFCDGIAHAAGLLQQWADEGSQPTTETGADFFQPGHTYTSQVGYDTAEFQVEHIGHRPTDGTRRAFGWYRRQPRMQWHAFSRGESDYTAWIDVTGEAS